MTDLALIVDDSAVNRQLLARHLATIDIEAREAGDGRAALEMLREGASQIGVVLLDVVMPEMDGYETLAAIKADESLRHLPVIMISGVDELDSVVRCIASSESDTSTSTSSAPSSASTSAAARALAPTAGSTSSK